ncbi:MAG: hypothetical protein IJM79_01145 [Erysipelotrichaceae bacterium]|nr:hypothetical protein [Erysipelotrichaceae bacterium]
MEFAVDKNNSKVKAIRELPEGEYFCPICHGKLTPRTQGDINIPHFAHETSECTDTWHYDMSEWHVRMQNVFEEKYQEIVCESNGTKHIADILKDGVVIEFQHSPISVKEFQDRNEFYHFLGYRIVWIFDVEEQYSNGQLSFMKRDDATLMLKWNYPKQVLQFCPKISDYNKNFVLYLYWVQDDGECINKIIWSSTDDEGMQDFKRIIISPYETTLSPNMNLNELFYSKKDYLCDFLKAYPRYEKKVIGERGHREIEYTCPRRNEFGLYVFGQKGCRYCKHCAAIEEKKGNLNKKSYVVYCCYPEQVYEPNGAIYECDGAPIF